MSVPVGERKESTVEFENAYFKIYEDAVRITTYKFGGDKKYVEQYSLYVETMSKKVMETVCDIGKFIRIANSIYPICKLEYQQRRLSQDKAIGLCYDLLTKYQMSMKILKVNDNKYINEIKNIEHEINSLKKWRISDNKRFKDITG